MTETQKCCRTKCKNELPDNPYTWIVNNIPSPLLFCSPICIAIYEGRIKQLDNELIIVDQCTFCGKDKKPQDDCTCCGEGGD